MLADEVRAVLALPGFGDASVDESPAPLRIDGDSAIVAQIVFQTLLGFIGRAPAVELRRDGDAAVLEAHGTRNGRPARDGGLALAVAGALARGLGGSLDTAGDGTLRLSLPLA